MSSFFENSGMCGQILKIIIYIIKDSIDIKEHHLGANHENDY